MDDLLKLGEDKLLSLFLPIIAQHNDAAKAAWLERFSSQRPLVLGPGDDCAILQIPDLTVTTIDTLTQDHDFRFTWPSSAVTTGFDLGWKAAAQNLADVAAMGATPVSLLVSLTLTSHLSPEWVADFAGGLCQSLLAHGVPWCTVAGGDLGLGSELSVTIAASGTCAKAIQRSQAKAGDLVAVAGELGTAAAGLALLESAVYQPGENADLDTLVTCQQRPLAAVQAGMKATFAHAMMDISDGLLRDAERIAKASSCSINIDSAALAEAMNKLLPAAEFLTEVDSAYFGQDPQQLALHWCLTGGENHGMLATFAPDEISQAKTLGFVILGKIEEPADSHLPAVEVDGQKYQGKGWDHFEA